MDEGQRTFPCCASLHHEDRDHILRCPSAERNRWHRNLLTTLANACTTNHTYEPLKDLLLAAVRQWLYPEPESNDTIPQRENYALELQPLIDAQTRIGWRQLFNGRFCQHWADLQNTHLYHIRHHLPTKNNYGQKWQVAIITVLWEEWHNLWVMKTFMGKTKQRERLRRSAK